MGPSSRRRDFRMYLAGQASSTFGSVFTGTATSVVAVSVLHASAIEVGVLVAATSLPSLVLGPLAGLVADRARRPRLLLVLSDLLAATAILSVAAGLVAGIAGFGWLVVLNLALGVREALVGTAFFTHLAALAPGRLAHARARLQSSIFIGSAVGRAVAAPAVAGLGGPFGYLVDAVSYLISATSLRAIRSRDHNPALDSTHGTTQPWSAALATGARVLVATPALRSLAVFAFIGQVGTGGASALYALFVLSTLGLPVSLYGIPTLAATLLGVAGSVLAPRLLDAGWSARRLAVGGFVAADLVALAVPFAGGPPAWSLIVLGIGVAVPALFGALSNVGLVAYLSTEIDDAVFGRVSALLTTLITGGSVAGAVVAGQLGGSIGVRPALACCSGLGVLSLLVLRPLLRGTATPRAFPVGGTR